MSELEAFNYECLYAHNGLRKDHGVPPLNYSKKLALEAQKYAEVIAARGEMEHSKKEDRDNAGENLASSMRPFVNYTYSGLGATVSWYSEIKDYDFTKEAQNANNEPTGHFTQVIWKGGREAGFGKAKNPQDNNWYVVGRYQPAGNFVGQYKDNVPPLSKGLKWDKITVVEEYLNELRTMEYTDGRKHILDNWQAQWMSGTNADGAYCDVTEVFTTPNGTKYSETKSYKEDPRKLPRPKFKANLDSGNHDLDDGQDLDDIYNEDEDDGEIELFINALHKHHNIWRAKHGVGNLVLDQNLTKHAQDWANELVMENQMKFSDYQFENMPLGENITTKKDKLNEEAAKSLVESWYSEGKQFTYRKEPSNFKNVGHFTQMVWKSSKKMGVGVGQSSSGANYIVCFYHPAGNVANKFSDNVLKPGN